MAKTRHIGIKFPFTRESKEKKFLDLDIDPVDGIISDLMHLIFTPKGQRLRDPEFGTNLIQFIFEPNDDQTWGDVEMEIKECVSKNIPNCSINHIEIYDVEDGRGLVAEITFSVVDGTYNNTYKITTKL